MNIYEEIKSRVSTKEVLESYGIYPVRGKNIYRCIEHSPDKKPSANIIKGQDRFHCFVCHKSWDIFDIVEHFEKCNHKESVKILDNRFNLGLMRQLTHKEKLELARQQRERDRLKAEKEQWEQFRKETRFKIMDNINFWAKIQKLTHPTRAEHRNGTWQFEDLFFYSLKQQKWLYWLYDTICNLPHKEPCLYDHIYGNDSEKVLKLIQNKKIIL